MATVPFNLTLGAYRFANNELDVKFVPRVGQARQRFYQFTAIDEAFSERSTMSLGMITNASVRRNVHEYSDRHLGMVSELLCLCGRSDARCIFTMPMNIAVFFNFRRKGAVSLTAPHCQ